MWPLSIQPLVAAILLLFLAGCGGGDGARTFEPVEDSATRIQRFVRGYNLSQVQPTRITTVDSARRITLFYVYYGAGEDCPAGCIYSGGVGLLYRNKIGWLSFANQRDATDPNRQASDVLVSDRYAFDGSDEYLYSDAYQETLRNDDTYSRALDVHLNALAVHPNTPIPLLRSLVREGEPPFYFSRARFLLQNPAVRTNREILQTIADLPMQGTTTDYADVYEMDRIEARRLLAVLNAGG